MILSVVESLVTLAKPRKRKCPLGLYGCGQSPVAIYAAAVSLSASTSRRNSASGIANSVKPQSKHTKSLGKTNTTGFPRLLSPGKWMAISPLKLLWCSDWHDWQGISASLGLKQPANQVPIVRFFEKSRTSNVLFAAECRLVRKSEQTLKDLTMAKHGHYTLSPVLSSYKTIGTVSFDSCLIRRNP